MPTPLDASLLPEKYTTDPLYYIPVDNPSRLFFASFAPRHRKLYIDTGMSAEMVDVTVKYLEDGRWVLPLYETVRFSYWRAPLDAFGRSRWVFAAWIAHE